MTPLEKQIKLIRNCLKIAELHLDEIESGAFTERIMKKYEETKKDKS